MIKRSFHSRWFRGVGSILPLVLMVLVLTGCPVQPSYQTEGTARGAFTSSTGGSCQSLRAILSFAPDENQTFKRFYRCLSTDVPVRKGIATYIVDYTDCKLKLSVSYVFQSIANAGWYRLSLKIAFSLAIIFYGIILVLGFQSLQPFEVLALAVKMIIVYALVTQFDLYDQYVIQFFENLIRNLGGAMAGTLFMGGPGGETVYQYNEGGDGVSVIVTNTVADGPGITGLGFADNTISTILSFRFMKVFLALLGAGFTGWIYAMLMAIIVFFYASAIIRVLYVFVMSLVMRYILYMVGPIFLIFMLFKQTREMFSNWIKGMLNYSLKPIFLMAILGIFHRTIIVFFGKMVANGYAICYGQYFNALSVLGQNFLTFNWWQFQAITSGIVEGATAGIPLNLWAMVTVAILAFLLREMVGWIEDLTQQMTQSAVSATQFTPLWGAAAIRARAMSAAGRPIGAMSGAIFGAKNEAGDRVGGIVSVDGVKSVARLPGNVMGVFTGGGGMTGVVKRGGSMLTNNTITRGANAGWDTAANTGRANVRRQDRALFGMDDPKTKPKSDDVT